MTEASVLFEKQDGGGWITLNRPHALNALNLEMVQAITEKLIQWEADDDVNYVVIQGNGRGFCAGGDLRAVYEAIQNGNSDAAVEFFKVEYHLNLMIHNYSKPYISLLPGITMGGGMGLSIHGTYRVVSENSVMAMPETAIGLFPDVGAAWFLNRCPGKSGLYVALTSARINYLSALYMGLATHYVPLAGLEGLIEAIRESRGQNLAQVLETHQQRPEGRSVIQEEQSLIDGYFNQNSIEEVFQALASSNSIFAVTNLEALKLRSPLSLRAAFGYLKRAENMSIEDVLEQDLEFARACIQADDLYEGIRATVIDKDLKPVWKSEPIVTSL